MITMDGAVRAAFWVLKDVMARDDMHNDDMNGDDGSSDHDEGNNGHDDVRYNVDEADGVVIQPGGEEVAGEAAAGRIQINPELCSGK